MIKTNTKFLICGGDKRFVTLANSLANEKYNVSTFGLPKELLTQNICCYNDLFDAITGEDIIILPLPVSKDNEFLFMSYNNAKIPISTLFSYIKRTQIVLGGNFSKELLLFAKSKELQIIDYYKREDIQILNAIPTVEGTIKIAIEEMPVTLHGCKILIIWYGRIGKLLAQSLKSLGAEVYVETRKSESVAYAYSNGFKTLSLNEISKKINDYDLIINTAPVLIFDELLLKKINKDILFIDLASEDGGIDKNAAEKLNIKVIHAKALPGKVAPVTAGLIIKDVILNILNEPEGLRFGEQKN